MPGFAVLDVAIGLIFVFLLLSLACSAANEMVEAVLKNRAFDLERGLRELLSPNGAPAPGSIVARIYDHPIVNGLFKGTYADFLRHMGRNPAWRWIMRVSSPDLPSYIPARNFALALMDTVLPGAGGPACVDSGAADATGSAPAADAIARLRAAVALELAKAQRNAPATPTPIITAVSMNAPTFPAPTITPAGTPSAGTPDPVASSAAQTWQSLLVLIDAAGGDVVKTRENIEGWFNSSMDRVSGWYKRRAQAFILVMGAVLTIALNVDAISVVNKLYTDKALREALVASADVYVKAEPILGAADPAKDAGLAADCGEVRNKKLPACALRSNLDKVNDLQLPIGWAAEKSAWEATRSHWLGWLLTALAISLGAPFWFDLLNKIIVVRSTVKPHEKSPEEPAKT